MAEKKTNVNLQKCDFSKSNALVRASYSLSLPGNRVLAMICWATASIPREELNGDTIVEVTTNNMIKMFGCDSGNTYQAGIAVAEELRRVEFTYVDVEKGKYVSSILLPNVVYDEGTYRVTMNPWLIDAIWQRGRNYTQFTLAEMAGFSSAYAFRLYEYLKSQCYQHDGKLNETDIYVITVNMYELAFIIGVVVLNNKKSNALFNEKKYKEAFFAVDNPKYTKAAWVLRQKVIDKAVESVNKNSKLQVTYAHNKDTLRFNVTVSHKELFSFVSHIRGLIPKLTEKNAQSIYRQAAGDMGLVEQALAEYEKAKDVKNPTGYIINVIRQMQTANWEPKEDRPKKNSKKKECEHNFSQRKYNFDEMERELLNYNEENEQK